MSRAPHERDSFPMRTSRFRTAVADVHAPALGMWIKIPAMEIMELVAHAGFDFAIIDLEHSLISLESAYRLIGTALYTGVSPLVRVPGLDVGLVQRVLDSGAEGVVFPHVDTVVQARAAVSAVRFPPFGSRGMGSTGRAGTWGARPREDYIRYGQQEVVLIAQIESATAVRNAGAIAALDGIDALLVGAADLSVGEGKAASDPAISELIAHAVGQARAASVPVGNAGGATVASVRAAVDAGFSFTTLSNDASLWRAAAEEAVEAARTVTYEEPRV